MAVYAIGDIQGCHLELLRLLERLRFDPAVDRLWLTGDLVNRGPDSLAVLRFVRGLGDAATVVLGNHDLHLLAVAAGLRAPRPGDEGLEPVLEAPDRELLLDWLARQPLLCRDPALGWTMVHAGLPPQWDLDTAAACAREVEQALAADREGFLASMYGNQPDCWAEGLDRADRLRFTVNCLTRLRFVDAAGRLLLAYKGPIDSAPRGAIPWFRHPGRLFAGERIVAGHWSALGYTEEDGVVTLDTGCVWGGSLCAVRLDAPGKPVRVACRGSLRPAEDRAGAD
jgi:bis(5'-nucleosyl)-tetraphosphatase (symmetrical)